MSRIVLFLIVYKLRNLKKVRTHLEVSMLRDTDSSTIYLKLKLT